MVSNNCEWVFLRVVAISCAMWMTQKQEFSLSQFCGIEERRDIKLLTET